MSMSISVLPTKLKHRQTSVLDEKTVPGFLCLLISVVLTNKERRVSLQEN